MKRTATQSVFKILAICFCLAFLSQAVMAADVDLKFSHSFSPMHTMQKKSLRAVGEKTQ